MDKITEIAKIGEELTKQYEKIIITNCADGEEIRITNAGIEKKKKVCIMGFAPHWTQTPFDNPEYEIWTLNEAYKLFQTIPNSRADRWFEIHSPDSPSKNTKAHTDFLKNCKVPIYMQEHYDDIPMSVEYPRQAIKDYFNQQFIVYEGGSAFTEFSNSIAWMIALAIYEGFETIMVTGVDMAQTDEYAWQRSSCSFFIGFAAGRGIKIIIPQASELCKFPQDYGFETDNQVRIKMKARKKELIQRKNGMMIEIQKRQQEIQQFEASLNQLDGAVQEIKYNLNNHIV